MRRVFAFFGLKRNIFVLGLVSFLTDVSSDMIYPLLPIFLTKVIKVNMVFVGLVEAIAESTASILKVVSGWISDRVKKRKVLVFSGYVLSAISKPFFALAQQGWHVMVVRFGDRVGKGIRTSPRDALIADSTDSKHLGKSYGFHRAMDSFGAVIGPLLAFLILPIINNNYRVLFLISFIPVTIAVLLIAFFIREKKRQDIEKENSGGRSFSFRGFNKNFKLFILALVIFTLGNSSDAFLILRAENIGISIALIPILWLFFNIVYTLTSMPGGMLSDKIGRKKVILVGFTVYGLCYLGFASAKESWHIWTLFAIYGIYYGITDGVLRAYVADLVPREVRATAFGIYHTAVGITAFPASLIMGILWQNLGVGIAFTFGATLALVAGLVLAILV